MNRKQNWKMNALFFIILIILLGYSRFNRDESGEKDIFLAEYNFAISLPEGWKELADTNFDLQLTNGKAYLSVFVYFKNELAEYQSPLDVHEEHIEELFSGRENVRKLKEENIKELPDKEIYSVLYSAEYKGVENYYYCNLLDFKEGSDIFSWIVITTLPSYFEENNTLLDEIIETVKWKK